MIKRLFVLVIAVGLMAATMTVGAYASGDPFAGLWVGQEEQPPNGDGSTDYMAIGRPGPNGARTWLYYETWATFCGGGPLAAAGKGYADGNVLTVTVKWLRCENGSPGAFPPPFDLTMSATGDGHIDWGGVIFSRIGSG